MLSQSATAQNAENELLRRTQMQLRQSEQERNSLRSEVARLQSHLDSQMAELEGLRKQASQNQGKKDTSSAELSARTAKLNQATEALQQSQAELEQARAQNARQTQAVQNVQAMLNNAQKVSSQRSELMELCRNRNQELFNVANEILTMYRDPGFNSFTKREPVLQFQQVKLQNLTQDFEDRLRKQRVYEDTLPPSVEKAMQESMQQKTAGNAGTPPG